MLWFKGLSFCEGVVQSAPLRAGNLGTSTSMQCMLQVPCRALLCSAHKLSSQRRARPGWPSLPLGEYFEGCAGQNPGPAFRDVNSLRLEGKADYAPVYQQLNSDDHPATALVQVSRIVPDPQHALELCHLVHRESKDCIRCAFRHYIQRADSYRPPQVIEFALVGLRLDVMQANPPVFQVLVLL